MAQGTNLTFTHFDSLIPLMVHVCELGEDLTYDDLYTSMKAFPQFLSVHYSIETTGSSSNRIAHLIFEDADSARVAASRGICLRDRKYPLRYGPHFWMLEKFQGLCALASVGAKARGRRDSDASSAISLGLKRLFKKRASSQSSGIPSRPATPSPLSQAETEIDLNATITQKSYSSARKNTNEKAGPENEIPLSPSSQPKLLEKLPTAAPEAYKVGDAGEKISQTELGPELTIAMFEPIGQNVTPHGQIRGSGVSPPSSSSRMAEVSPASDDWHGATQAVASGQPAIAPATAAALPPFISDNGSASPPMSTTELRRLSEDTQPKSVDRNGSLTRGLPRVESGGGMRSPSAGPHPPVNRRSGMSPRPSDATSRRVDGSRSPHGREIISPQPRVPHRPMTPSALGRPPAAAPIASPGMESAPAQRPRQVMTPAAENRGRGAAKPATSSANGPKVRQQAPATSRSPVPNSPKPPPVSVARAALVEKNTRPAGQPPQTLRPRPQTPNLKSPTRSSNLKNSTARR